LGRRGPARSRVESERWKVYSYEELLERDKANLDLLWLKDDSLQDAADLPAPDVLAREIIGELASALDEFNAIVVSLDALLDGNGKGE